MSYAQPAQSGRRLPGLVIVVLLHVVMIYALVYGLARKIVEVVSQPLETKIVEEIKPPPPDKPPPPPPPRLAAPPYIPPPEITLQAPPTVPTITAVTDVKPAAPVPPPGRPVVQAPAPVRAQAVVDAKACEKPPYPPASLRASEIGIVQLSFLIDTNGKVLESKIDRSSGFRRLDEAARNGLGLCKFKPATLDGKPERSWARIEYEWKIE